MQGGDVEETERREQFKTTGEVNMKNVQKGFTLIELMIVVAIIGILAAVAIPAYQDYIARSQAAEAAVLLGGLKTPIAEYYNTNGTVPSKAQLGNATFKGKYVATISAEANARYQATFKGSDVSAKLRNKTISMTFNSATGEFTWSCGSLDTALQPKVCN